MAWEAPLSGASSARTPRRPAALRRECVRPAPNFAAHFSPRSLFQPGKESFFRASVFFFSPPAAAVIVFDAAFLFTARELFERMRFTRADPLHSVSSFSRYFYILAQIKPYPSPRGKNFTYSYV